MAEEIITELEDIQIKTIKHKSVGKKKLKKKMKRATMSYKEPNIDVIGVSEGGEGEVKKWFLNDQMNFKCDVNQRPTGLRNSMISTHMEYQKKYTVMQYNQIVPTTDENKTLKAAGQKGHARSEKIE